MLVDAVILCGGKCGSSTLYESFFKSGIKSIKVHNKQDFQQQFGYDGLYDCINKSSEKKKIFIIDSYRTNVEREISSFFQNLDSHVPDNKNKTTQQLISIFNSNFLGKLEKNEAIDPVMKDYNLPLFSSFNFNNKFIMERKGNIVFVKILFSDIKEWGNILTHIIGKKIVIIPNNLSSDKKYIEKYEEFKKLYKIPKNYLNNELKNNHNLKIYTRPDIYNAYILKWENNCV